MISIVILNWNGNKYLFNCIESIKKQTYKNFELIIVDNCSSDGSIERLIKENPQYQYILNESNYGFAKGMNIGIKHCKGDVLVLLNNDIYLKEDFLEKILNKYEEYPGVSCLEGIAKCWDNGELTDVVQSRPSCFKHRVQGGGFNSENDCLSFGPHGSFVIIKKDAINDVILKSGYVYDEDFETGWEDSDLWFRLQLFGHKCMFTKEIIAWHVGSASDNENIRLIDKSFDYQVRIFRNRYYLIKKNYTKQMIQHEFFYLIAAECCLFPYYLIKAPKSIKALIKGKKLYKNNKVKMIEKRNKIRENVTVDYKYIKSLYRGF